MWRSFSLRAFLACLAFSVVLLSSFAAPLARAQSEDVRERAKALFEKGLDASDSERWAEAADLFTRSRALLSRPSTVFNLVGALYRLGRYRESLAAVRDYLGMSDPLVDAAKRQEVEGLRAVMEKAIGTARIEVSPADATLDVDGERQVAGKGGYTLPLDPGLHALVARRAGHRDHSETFAIESGGSVNLQVVLQANEVGPVATPVAEPMPLAGPAEEPAPARAPQRDDVPRKRMKRALWITGAVVVAGAVATGLAVALGGSKEEEPCRTTTCVVVD
jgi:hypothetical protein